MYYAVDGIIIVLTTLLCISSLPQEINANESKIVTVKNEIN